MSSRDFRFIDASTGKIQYYKLADSADMFIGLDEDGQRLYENDRIIVMRYSLNSVKRDITVEGTIKMSAGQGAYIVISGRKSNLYLKRGWKDRIYCKLITDIELPIKLLEETE